MSPLLEKLDCVFRTVQDRQACSVLLVRRHGAVVENLPVAFVVVSEQAGGEVVAAAVPLAEIGIDLHFHCAAPVCVVMAAGARAETSRVSNAPHSSSPTACRSGVMSALPMASRRQKWASAFGDSDGSSSPSAWAMRTSSASQSPRSPT